MAVAADVSPLISKLPKWYHSGVTVTAVAVAVVILSLPLALLLFFFLFLFLCYCCSHDILAIVIADGAVITVDADVAVLLLLLLLLLLYCCFYCCDLQLVALCCGPVC